MPACGRSLHPPRPALALLGAVLLACTDGTAPDAGGGPGSGNSDLSVVVAGTAVSDEGAPLEGVTVWAQLERSTAGWTYGPAGNAVTGADGTYAIELGLDSLPAEGSPELRTEARTAPGTGYAAIQYERREVTASGTGETIENDLVLTRVADPAAPPPFPSLDPADLLTGMYDGEPIPPHSLGFATWLRFRVDSAPGLVYGRWNMTYAATTVGGEGTFTGSLSGDTLHLVLADTANGVPGGNCGGTFELDVVAEAASADTLIAWLSRGTATGCHVEEAPFRVARVPVSAGFE
jgi:hypothetical protein